MHAPTPAIGALAAAGVAHRVHRYDLDPHATSYGAEVATALEVDTDRTFKTLIVRAGASLVVAVVPVSAQLDLKALARVAGAKRAELAEPADAERSSGYVVGGISPLGQKQKLPTFIDQSAQDWETVYVSAGRRGLELELAPDDLVAMTDGHVARIART